MRCPWLALAALPGVGSAAGLPPVVLVPGLTGSGLEARMSHAAMPHWFCWTDTNGTWIRVWVELKQLVPLEKDCLVARLQLTYDSSSGVYSNRPGVEIRPVDFGGMGGIGELDPGVSLTREFAAMAEHLRQKHGYELGKNLHGAPYDWRLAADAHAEAANGVGGFYPMLQQLIERTVKENGQKAVVVSHSLGCPTMLFFFNRFVSEEWRAAHIRGWVALAGPWLGSARQASSYTGGDNLGVPFLPHDYVKPVQVNATSGVWLSPHPRAFGDRPIIVTPSANYTAAQLPEVVSAIGEAAGGEQTLSLFRKSSIDLAGVQQPPTNVPMQNWYSSGHKTPEAFRFSKDIAAGFNEAADETYYGEGDGTVNLLSLKQPERWPAPPSAKVSSREFPGANHFQMLTDSRVLDALSQFLEAGEATEVWV